MATPNTPFNFKFNLDMGQLLTSMEQKAKLALKVNKKSKKQDLNEFSPKMEEENKLTEEEIMKSLNADYYQENYDAVGTTLSSLPADVDER
jgi:hypothetical protein